jgi:hypothetical protein
MENYIPIFQIVIDEEMEDSGFIRNSFVSAPAVEITRFAFSKQNQKMIFAENAKEQIFTSVSILADTPILRVTESGEKFYVVFTKDVIRKIRNKMVKEGKTNEVSLYHEDDEIQDGIYMVENFIINKGRVESPLFDVPEGSLVTSYWVEDTAKYEALLNDENFNGFSIEINARISQMFSNTFDALYTEEMKEQQIRDIAFSEELNDEQKEEKIREVLNKV